MASSGLNSRNHRSPTDNQQTAKSLAGGKDNLHRVFSEYCSISSDHHGNNVQALEEVVNVGLFSSLYFRLSSFNLGKEDLGPWSASQLAADGYFKTPFHGEVQCYACGYNINLIQNSTCPFTGHKRYRNSCSHLKSKYAERESSSRGALSSRDREYAQGLNNEVQRNHRLVPRQRYQIPTGTQGRYGIAPCISSGNVGAHHASRQLGSRSDRVATDPVTQENQRRRRNINRQVAVVDFRYELCRFQSYTNWPSNASISPEELSNAGFYYMGMDDRVQCIFCRGILRCWEPEDKALAEHLRHFPQCPFLLDPSAVGNVALGDEDERLFSAVQTRNGGQVELASAALEGVITSTPIHTDKVHISARLATFRDFPTNTWHKADQLAEAGFFYMGQIDKVCCYFCNLTVSHWQRGDDPWVVHARKSDKCGFLLMSKDKAFIEKAKNKTSRSNKPVKRRQKRFAVKEGDIDKFMEAAFVQGIKENYEEALLRKVVKRRFQELGEGFPNAETLFDAVLEFEEDPDESSDLDDGGASLECEGESKQNKVSEAQLRSKMLETDCEEDENLDVETLTQQNAELVEERRCKVCLEEPACIVFLRCGHLVCCSSCAPALTRCPICRDKILGTICVDM